MRQPKLTRPTVELFSDGEILDVNMLNRRGARGCNDGTPLPATLVCRRRQNVFRREGQRRAAARLHTFRRPSIGDQAAQQGRANIAKLPQLLARPKPKSP